MHVELRIGFGPGEIVSYTRCIFYINIYLLNSNISLKVIFTTENILIQIKVWLPSKRAVVFQQLSFTLSLLPTFAESWMPFTP